MTKIKTLMTVGVCMISFGTPALAGKPDNPQEKGDLVEYNREIQQNAQGPSGLGMRISSRAKDTTVNKPFRNFGDYLKQMTSGPTTERSND